MSSTRETAMQALLAVLATALATLSPAPTLIRNDDAMPETIPAGGLVVLRDGDSQTVETLLSPLSYVIEQGASAEIAVKGATTAARAQALDLLLLTIGNAVAANRTLGGAADWAEPGTPQFGSLDWDGAMPDGNAVVPITITFTAAAHPLA